MNDTAAVQAIGAIVGVYLGVGLLIATVFALFLYFGMERSRITPDEHDRECEDCGRHVQELNAEIDDMERERSRMIELLGGDPSRTGFMLIMLVFAWIVPVSRMIQKRD